MHRTKFLLYIISLTICLFLTGCSGFLNGSKDNQDTYDIEKGVLDFVYEDSFQYDESLIEKWTSSEAEAVLDSIFKEKPEAVYFIRGNLAKNDGDEETCKELFEKALETLDKNTQPDIYAKILYEKAKWAIYDEKYDEGKAYIEEIQNNYEGKENRNYQIRINLLWAYDVLETPNGAQSDVEIMNHTRKIAEEYGYEDMCYVIYYQANAYANTNSVTQANNYYSEALKIARELDDKYWINSICTDIGVNYLNVNNYEKSIKYLNEALDNSDDASINREQLNEKKSYIYDQLASAYIGIGNFTDAKKFLDLEIETIEMFPEGKSKEDNTMNYYCSLGAYEIAMKNYDKALEYLDKSYEMYNSSDYSFFLNFDCYLYQNHGKLYFDKGDYDTALEYYKKIEDICLLQNDGTYDLQCTGKIYEIYCEKKEYDKALEYSKIYVKLLNDKYKTQEQQNEDYVSEKLKANEKQSEIDSLKYRNRTLNIIIVGVGLIILVGITFLITMHKQNRQIKELNSKLTTLSKTDGLSGLNNRHSLTTYLEYEWDEICENSLPVSVAMLDIDFFKKFNDAYGHQEGDRIIKVISDLLMNNKREYDFVARYGGEEFLFILPDTEENTARKLFETIQGQLQELAIENKKSTVSDQLTISVGIASSAKPIEYLEIISMADSQLYKAKEKRNTISAIEA